MAIATEVKSNNTAWDLSGRVNSQALWDATFYNEMRHKAVRLLRNQHPENAIQPEDLVHETYLRLTTGIVDRCAKDEDHYFAIAALIMKRSLIDHLRASRAIKRFGHLRRVELTPDMALSTFQPFEFRRINDLLNSYASSDARRATVARLYFLEERTLEEIAAALRLSTRTVKRDLKAATLQLRKKFASPPRPLASYNRKAFSHLWVGV